MGATPTAALGVVPRAGHHTPADEPAAVTEALEPFWKAPPGAARG